jgi:hypothetical protein
MGNRAKREDQVDGVDAAGSEAGRAPSRVRWAIAGAVFGIGVATWVGIGRERRGSGEAGGTLDGAVQTIPRGVQDTSAAVGEQLAQARTSARNLGIEQQIAARLHGDKALDAEKIIVQVEDQGTAVLKGLVSDTAAKDKVVALTRDTRGVLKVVDQLAVVPSPRVIVAPPADAAAPAVAGRPDPVMR